MIKFIGYRNKIRWYSQTYYVDIETGEIIEEKQIKEKEYYIVKRTKKIITNNETSRTITRTNACRKQAYQRKIW